MIKPSDLIKAAFRANGKKALEALKSSTYGQDENAFAVLFSLKDAGADFTSCEPAEVLEILKLGGNASAARQALEGKAATKTATISEGLLAMVNG